MPLNQPAQEPTTVIQTKALPVVPEIQAARTTGENGRLGEQRCAGKTTGHGHQCGGSITVFSRGQEAGKQRLQTSHVVWPLGVTCQESSEPNHEY